MSPFARLGGEGYELALVDLEVTRSERCTSADVPPVAECVTLVERRTVKTADRRSVVAVVGAAALAFGAGVAVAHAADSKPRQTNQ